MTAQNLSVPSIFAIALVVLVTALNLWKGAIYGSLYEGDVIHFTDFVLRVASGERPHEDFMTPLGIGAVAPIAMFVAFGFGIGMSVFLGQAALAAAVAPLVVWVAISRFRGGLRYVYMALVLLLILGLVQGSAEPRISMSVHYNRWGWALAFIALPVAMLPARAKSDGADALALGLAMAGLVLLKVTFVIALVPGIVVLLVARGRFTCLWAAVAVTILSLGIFTIWSGWEYWWAYAGNLLETATSQSRSYPSLSLDGMLIAPGHLVGHMAALAAIVLLRRSHDPVLGLGLLILLPGFVYITWQNFGNDPIWTGLVGLVVLASIPFTQTSKGIFAAAVTLVAVAGPSLANIAISPLRNATAPASAFRPLFSDNPRHRDLLTQDFRADRIDLRIIGREVAGLDPELSKIGPDLNGEEPARCLMDLGLAGWMTLVARDLVAAGYAGRRIMVADLVGAIWLFGPSLPRLPGSAPWVYGGAPGLEAAEFLLVPHCPSDPQTQAAILAQIARTERALTKVHETASYTLYEVSGPQPMAASPK